jgi:hypothetical protein
VVGGVDILGDVDAVAFLQGPCLVGDAIGLQRENGRMEPERIPLEPFEVLEEKHLLMEGTRGSHLDEAVVGEEE